MKTYLAAMVVVTVLLGATMTDAAEVCIDLGGGIISCEGEITVVL